MSFNRVTLVALATFFTIGMTSLASAGCCNYGGYSGSVVYVPVAPTTYGGCGGGCGAPLAPVTYGCGNCGGPTAATIYAQPVAPAPIVVSAPIGGGCGNCGGWGAGWASSGGCGGCGITPYAVEPSPQLYVVNQGPDYSGPGLTVPYATYSPETAYAPAADYPYVPGYGYGRPAYPHYYSHRYYGERYAFHAPAYMHPRFYGGASHVYGVSHGYGMSHGYGGAHWGHTYR